MQPITAFLIAALTACGSGQGTRSPAGSVRVTITGLSATAANGGSLTIVPSGSAPVTLSIPAAGAASSDVPVGEYSVTYTPPVGYTLVPGQPSPLTVIVTEGAPQQVTFAVIATGSIVAPVSNEPPGFVEITSRPFTTSAEAQWSETPGFGYVMDSHAPESPPGVAEAVFPAGTELLNFLTRRDLGTTLPGIYVSFWFMLSNGWSAPSTNQTSLARVFSSGVDPLGVRIRAAGAGAGLYDALLELSNSGTQGPLATLPGAAKIVPGQWHHWEAVLIIGSGGGVADGSAQWWLDGSPVGSVTGIVYPKNNLQPRTWGAVEWQPSWTGSRPVPATQSIWIDHIYVSGN